MSGCSSYSALIDPRMSPEKIGTAQIPPPHCDLQMSTCTIVNCKLVHTGTIVAISTIVQANCAPQSALRG